MFNSMEADSSRPVQSTWHAGCNVINGTKIILQKFKELPYSERRREVADHQREKGESYRPYIDKWGET